MIVAWIVVKSRDVTDCRFRSRVLTCDILKYRRVPDLKQIVALSSVILIEMNICASPFQIEDS